MTASPQPVADLWISWDDIDRLARALAAKARPFGPFLGVAAVTRGGMVPAAIVACELDIRLIDTVCVSSYADMTRGDVEILKSTEGDGSGWLIVDDLVDTGETMRALRKLLPKARVATVFAKPMGRSMADWYVVEVPQDNWLRFPWECPADLRPSEIAVTPGGAGR